MLYNYLLCLKNAKIILILFLIVNIIYFSLAQHFSVKSFLTKKILYYNNRGNYYLLLIYAYVLKDIFLTYQTG